MNFPSASDSEFVLASMVPPSAIVPEIDTVPEASSSAFCISEEFDKLSDVPP